MTAQRVILASASPRRRELISLIVRRCDVVPSEFDESLVPREFGPAEHVVYSATEKARDVARREKDALVIGSDTVVAVDEHILGKPEDATDAARMLQMLSGRTHQVYTGVCVIETASKVERSACECTDVRFIELDAGIIARYVATGEPLDKAGGYAIQGRGAVMIEGINGDYFNVVGLPVCRLSRILEGFGVEVL